MAKRNQERETDDKKGSTPEASAWGTWEELLLAYAVNRFGTNSWDSISSELRKRSSAAIVFTPKNCKQKFQELERRFAESNGYDVDIDHGGETAAAAVPWIEELRKLRVAELQRELQNFDIYISSLQLKVKKLTEEIDKNSSGERTEKPDLGHSLDEIEIKNVEVDNKPPDLVNSDEKQVPGVDESDRENQSMNGSNGNLETGAEKSENESNPVEVSCDGRPDAKEPMNTEPGVETTQEPESQSHGTVENSDVQSSASKSKKEGSDRVRRGNSKADECDNDDLLKNSIPVRSLPLINILQKVHQLGSAVFERRLDRQEKLRYKNLIREHIDFEILQTRLKEGWYSDDENKFFRDLLLFINNTCIFFSKESPESIAAIELRRFILKEMTSNRKQKTDSKLLEKQSLLKPATLPPKGATEPVDLKPNLVAPMNACRKRSSIAAKESESSFGRKELSPSISKKTGKNVYGGNDIPEADSDQEQEQGKTSDSENSEVKSETKKKDGKKPIESEEKKRSAAKFLNRMKEISLNSNNEVAGVAAGGGSAQKRGGANKRSSGGRKLKEPDSPAKRSVSRPPKKAAAQPPAAANSGKRNREGTESESSISKQAKKRSKR